MDQQLGDVSSSMNGGIGYDLLDRLSLLDTVIDENQSRYRKVPSLPPERGLAGSARESVEDYDFSDVVLKYISQMLMEEDIEGKTCMFQESAALLAAEKSLYEVIGKKYPPSPDHHPVSVESSLGSPDETSACSCITANIGNTVDRNNDSHGPESSSTASQSVADFSSSYGFADSPMSTLQLPQIFTDSQSMSQFMKGFEEASKFLPDDSSLILGSTSNGQSDKNSNPNNFSSNGSRGKKNPHPDAADHGESRSHKQSALSSQSTVSSEMFDMVLLGCGGGDAALRESLQSAQHQDGKIKGPNEGKSRRKKQGRKRDVVDMRTLLTICAQAIAANDRRSANDLLGQIRRHSSPTGDGMQRMAHYFADGLEARLAGAGTKIYKALMANLPSAADVLKAYHLYLTICPFRKISNFFSNKTIMNMAEKATKLHIVDFGIMYGFQWPCLIQRLSSRPGGPPKLRITGIDLPQPGFRPADRVEETGRRLDNYAKTFGVPFEFKAIAQRWETILLEDLRIEPDEVLVVNCMFRLRNLLDDTVMVDNPRDIVLELIKKMNPNVFVLGIVNGAYSAPFFITRFREALFHYSTVFDTLEANVPRDIPERILIENKIFGREVMNVIACEGAERIERPETYKQCQVRAHRAGFSQLPLDEEIVDMAKNRVKSYYHKDFEINEDGRWLLQGWKGRILYALSTWKPAC
ncbi:scarecrow-like protein 14 [Punica granatum]|uniref:Uncharacterized protein n=2 Tax=Punica granatum TaxID=22663 RepID=A0A2I0KV63_PUNGR|nr:scarecrow-like protein 14 [Punica granatum]PKI72367.1 hypothetical protein CRG98_007237 [Punica granatum]